jgi:hypothetical protein
MVRLHLQLLVEDLASNHEETKANKINDDLEGLQ